MIQKCYVIKDLLSGGYYTGTNDDDQAIWISTIANAFIYEDKRIAYRDVVGIIDRCKDNYLQIVKLYR